MYNSTSPYLLNLDMHIEAIISSQFFVKNILRIWDRYSDLTSTTYAHWYIYTMGVNIKHRKTVIRY